MWYIVEFGQISSDQVTGILTHLGMVDDRCRETLNCGIVAPVSVTDYNYKLLIKSKIHNGDLNAHELGLMLIPLANAHATVSGITKITREEAERLMKLPEYKF